MEYGTPPTDNRTTLIEPWVDAATVGAHLGFKPDHIRKLASQKKLPGVQMQNGARVYWRFKLSAVDQVMAAEQRHVTLDALSSAISATARDLAYFNAPTIDQMNTGTPEVSSFVYRQVGPS